MVKGRGAKIYLPSPTWANHMNIFRHGGLTPEMYDYYDTSLGSFNLEMMLASINKAEDGSLFLMHSCAHNPTGSDPSLEQWDAIREAIQTKNHYVLFDNAYQVPDPPPIPLPHFSLFMTTHRAMPVEIPRKMPP
jgi:aspartate/tyrosine/aromatic aminotransferase